jgi:hypothetical protein
MSQDVRQAEVQKKTQQLLQGPLKHVRAAALAAALLPLASVVATPAAAQTSCPSGGICGTVFYDADGDGIQDSDEPGIGGASVTLIWPNGQTLSLPTTGCPDPPDPCDLSTVGLYNFIPPFLDADGFPVFGTFKIVVQIPPDTEPTNAEKDGAGNVFVSVEFTGSDIVADFGFSASEFVNPGTGTPGYWKNHPEAWPVQSITIGYKIVDGAKVGGVSYSIEDAIALLENVGKDKRTTMFSSLVPAMLNVLIENDNTCVASTIDAANAWIADYLPMNDVTKKVAASSYAWKVGEPLHRLMDNYNNGMLCAPHRE